MQKLVLSAGRQFRAHSDSVFSLRRWGTSAWSLAKTVIHNTNVTFLHFVFPAASGESATSSQSVKGMVYAKENHVSSFQINQTVLVRSW